MEDALAPYWHSLNSSWTMTVLILVVMEDALAHSGKEYEVSLKFSLNPCCNGRCTRTDELYY